MRATSRLQNRIWRGITLSCFGLQFGSLLTIALLVFLDERLESVSPKSLFFGQVASTSSNFALLLPLLAYTLCISFGFHAAITIAGDRSQRSLKNLFLLTGVVALALSLQISWQRISWEGRRYRMIERIESLQEVCENLQRNWPTSDMNHGLLGSIMAYPQWSPTTLILLTPKPIDDRFRIAAVDRTSKDVLRFELSSGYETIWLEHRLDSKLDQEFTNGIDQRFVRQRYVTLAPHWFLVRYE